MLGDVHQAPFLKGRIRGGEPDPENLSWAIGALHAVEGSVPALRWLRNEVDLDPLPNRLSPKYFSPSGPLPPELVRACLNGDDALAHQWLALLRGREPDSVPRHVLAELARSDDPLVVEYSVWALHHAVGGGMLDSVIAPQDTPEHRDNVRRWLYRLMAKSTQAAGTAAYEPYLMAGAADPSSAAREGLALGLGEIRSWSPTVVQTLGEWVEQEEDHLVLRALGQAIHRGRRTRLRDQFKDDHPEVAATLTGPRVRGARILRPTTRPARQETLMQAVPRIAASSDEATYLVAFDVVGFSTRPDKAQTSILQGLLDAVRGHDRIGRLSPDEAVVLLTGDGLILGVRGTHNRLLPIELARSVSALLPEVASYGVRTGLHEGTTAWLQMSDGSFQMIGHHVNWVVRVMASASEGDILVSKAYYEGTLRPLRNEVHGLAFALADVPETKHGEPVEAYRATSPASAS